ncbi:hypothetical protein [Priestia megaterium]|uniref:hypothetical protein n=1 Tax=Priestia megaterium TaxID=1404 RepID=UPI0022B88608|nr:hypothetical protein [Priestia megaterium]MCZ8493588.1 hypothetical protein [Priestia megaterium]
MKKRYIFALLALFLLTTACQNSSPPVNKKSGLSKKEAHELGNHLELVKVDVSIVTDKRLVGSTIITEGKDKGKELVPTSLYYEIDLKNTGKKRVGKEHPDKGIEMEIQPHIPLKNALEESVGFNVFNPDDNQDRSGLGYGFSSPSILEYNEQGNFTLNYDLGFKGSTNKEQASPLKASDQQLKKLEPQLLDGVLVVKQEKQVLAKFDMKTKKRIEK